MILPELGQQPVSIFIDLLPQYENENLNRQITALASTSPKKKIVSVLSSLIPSSLAQTICLLAGVEPSRPVHQLKKEDRKGITALLKNLPVTALRLRPIDQAIVTRGGIKTSEINPQTMQSVLVDNLYFAGEMIDVDGPCGGYNLQIAWSTGLLAGTNAAQQRL